MICHTADLCNCAIKWELSSVWARRVCDEATAQAKRELALGMQVEKADPYTEDELYSRQVCTAALLLVVVVAAAGSGAVAAGGV